MKEDDDDLTNANSSSPQAGSRRITSITVLSGTDELVLKKAVEAIFLRPVTGELTPLMHKSFNVLIAKAAEQGADKRIYTVPLKSIIKDTRYTSRDVAFFRECLKKLNGFQVEWDSLSPSGQRKGWGITTLLSEAEIIDGELHFGFSERIKKQLLIPAIYQSINLQLLSRFRTRAAMALYEICLRYATSPSGLTAKRPWREWRDLLIGTHFKVNEWRYFRRDTLDPAMREIANLADDIEIERLEYKDGRVVTDLQFQVRMKRQAGLALGTQDENLFNGELVERLVRAGFTDKFATELLLKYDEGNVVAALSQVEADFKRRPDQRSITSPTGFIRSSLENGWKHAIAESKALAPKPAAKQVEDPKVAARTLQRSSAFDHYEQLDEDAKAQVWSEFLPHLPIHLRPYERRGLKSKLILAAFGEWLIENPPATDDDNA